MNRVLGRYFLGFLMMTILTTASLSWGQGSAALCGPLFSPFTDTWIDRTIPMQARYLGENRGLYKDPLTNEPWNVKYFTAEEKRGFLLTPDKNGLLVHVDGRKADSEYDPGTLHFDTSLLVITKDREIYALPFEKRGRYHHSSLSSGNPVIFAGTVTFSEGKIRSISDQSGHYKPDIYQHLIAVRSLYLMGVDMNQMRIEGHLALDNFNTGSLTPAEVKKSLGILFENRTISPREVQALIKKENLK